MATNPVTNGIPFVRDNTAAEQASRTKQKKRVERIRKRTVAFVVPETCRIWGETLAQAAAAAAAAAANV